MDINVNQGSSEGPRRIEVGQKEQKSGHSSSDQLYLEKLEFDPKLRKSWLNFFIVNFRVVLLLIVVLTGVGLYSFFSLPRESNPEVKIPMAVVMTVYPGASPADIEELITKRVEAAVAGVKDVDKITSGSANSVSSVTVEFNAKANLDDSLRKLRDAVNNVKPDLPADANDPQVIEISFDDTPIWTVSITGPYDGFTLRQVAEDIKDEMEKIPGVREVQVSGGDEKEFAINYDPQKLALYNLTPTGVNSLIKGQNLAIPAGNFEGDKYTYPIRVDGRFFTIDKLANLPIMHTADGAILALKDVAEVKETAIKKTVYSRLSEQGGQPSEDITLQLIKKTGGNIVETVSQAKSAAEAKIKELPGVRLSVTLDYAAEIDKQFNQLGHDFILTLILVFAVLFLIVGLKEALVAGLAIPLVFFATFAAMLQTGISLNFLSMFSLILALGLLVDDAIVVVSATKQYLRTGKFTPEEAVLLVLNDFKVVLTTTTLTTVWAFLPLLMATGIIGEFIKSIPITVSVTLIASLIIALIINHPLAAVLERVRFTKKLFTVFMIASVLLIIGSLALPNKALGIIFAVIFLLVIIFLLRWYMRGGKSKLAENSVLQAREWRSDELIKEKLRHQGSGSSNLMDKLLHGIINFNSVLPRYERTLRRLIDTKKSRRRTLAVVGILFLIAVALPATGIVQSEFFPSADYEYLFVNITAPTGLKLDETDKIVRQIEERLLKYPQIDNFSTIVGQPSNSSGISVGGSSSSHLASVTIKLKALKERRIKSYDLADQMREDLSGIKEATVTVESPKGGPPSGSAFEAQIKGDDLQVLDRTAHELEPMLSSIPGVIDPEISLKESPADYSFSLDPNRLELYDLNAAYVGSVLRLAIAGTEVTTVLTEGDEIKVMARFDSSKIPDLESIQNLQVINLKGQPVFLKDVARIELKPSVEAIRRIDQQRAVTLTAGVSGGTNAALVVKEFQKKMKSYKLPDGYTISYGGENEQNAESVMSIINAMAVAAILIISTLIIQFNSLKKSLIVLVTIPLALIGVFFGLALTQINLSFPGLIGILALFGIVVKNAIILVDKISLNLKSGIAFKEAVVDAGKSRLEAIFITSICTILGIIPITLSNETWFALGGAIIFGLMLSSFLTLFIVPTLFVSLIKDEAEYNL